MCSGQRMRDYYPRNAVPWSLVAAVWKTLGQAVEVYSGSFSGYTVAWVDPMQGNLLVCSSFKHSKLKVQTNLFFSLPLFASHCLPTPHSFCKPTFVLVSSHPILMECIVRQSFRSLLSKLS